MTDEVGPGASVPKPARHAAAGEAVPGSGSARHAADASAAQPPVEPGPVSLAKNAAGTPPPPAAPLPPGAPQAAAAAPAEVPPVPDAAAPASWRQRRKLKKAQKVHRKAPWWELPALVILAIVIAILVKTFVVQPFYIPSDSMEQTLHGCTGCHGDRILVFKPVYDFRDPHPGDIIVFHAPPGWDNDEPTSKPPSNFLLRAVRGFGQLIGFVPPDGEVLVKRVIATAGQTVKSDSSGTKIMVSNDGPDGHFRTLHEPYVYIPAGTGGNVRPFGAVTVPKGRLWVMGDHRSDSADSRYHCAPGGSDVGGNDSNCDPTSSTVPISDVIGKAFVIAWPPSRWRTLGTPSTFENAALAVAPAVPSAVSLIAVAPVFLLRRRRRRR